MVVTDASNKIVLAPADSRGAPINCRHSVRHGVPVEDFAALLPAKRARIDPHVHAGRGRMWGSLANTDQSSRSAAADALFADHTKRACRYIARRGRACGRFRPVVRAA